METLKKNKNITAFTIHLVIWLLILGLPYMFFGGDSLKYEFVFLRYSIPLFFTAIIFYINYFFLVNEFYFKKKYFWFFLINIIIVVFLLWLITWADFSMPKPPADFRFKPLPPRGPRLFSPKTMHIYTAIIMNILAIVMSLALKISSRLSEMQKINRELDNKKLESELLHLKYQLQPHFFFNALNNIYSLVDSSPLLAKEAIHSLGKLMRYLLYETDEKKVSLKQEIEFIQQFIKLMQLRLTDKTKTIVVLPQNIENYNIAPLLFVPLIENAFKNGVSNVIESRIVIRMELIDNSLFFYTENQCHNLNNSQAISKGIGLENLKTRLELIYNNRYELKREIINNIYLVRLKIDLNAKC